MTQLPYLAILGRQPELGLIELESLLGSANIQSFGKKATLVGSEPSIDRLGGVVKLGEIIYRGKTMEIADLSVDWAGLVRAEGKTTFGLSYYGQKITPRAVLAAGLSLKKRLREFGSVRMVAPSDNAELSAAQLHHNKVLAEGFELLVVSNGREMVVARTTAVQDIEAYAERDHGRPARSAKVGMLPPKLAQILLNTTHASAVVDPFCGTGVVLQEALLMGRPATGFDLATDMVAATVTNMKWLVEQTSRPLPTWQVDAADARELRLPSGPLAVVSEGYLGTNLASAPAAEQLEELDQSISELYRAVLANLASQLPSGSELALCLPNWRTKTGWHQPAVVDDVRDLGYTFKVFKHAPGLLRYARADQTVGRQLLLLTRL